MTARLVLQKFNFRDLLAQYGAAILVAAVSFLLTALIARKIGPEHFGLYSTALAIGAILGIFLDFGFKQVVQREAAKSQLPFSYRQLQGVAIKNILVVALLFIAGCAILVRPYLLLAICIALCFCGTALTQQISAGLRGQRLFIRDAWHQVGSRAISAITIILSLLLFPDPAVVLGAWGIGTIAWALFAFGKFSRPSNGPIVPMIYKHAVPLFLIDLMIVIHFRVDLILMQSFGVDQTFIGNFSAALRIVELFVFFTFPIRSMLLTQIRQENPASIPSFFVKRCLLAATIALVPAIATIILAPVLIDVVFGAEFSEAANLLRIMIWLLVPSFVLAIIFETSVATNREYAYRTAALFVLVINLFLLICIIQSVDETWLAVLKVCLEFWFCLTAFFLVFRCLKHLH